MRKIHHICLGLAYVIIALIMALFVVLIFQSPGKPRPFIDKSGKVVPGSIAFIQTVNINDVDQKMIIRGRDSSKPVLLYLHGGPGSPEFPFVLQYNSHIEDLFVVCYWEQRGAGLSYSAHILPESMTLPQFVEDTRKVTEFLLKRFNREKIYLLGHSWGSLLGSNVANKYPEYYKSFIAVGQVVRQKESEELSYNFVLSKARESNDRRAVKTLEKIESAWSDPAGYISIIKKRRYIIKYGGAVKKGNFYLDAARALYNCREYTIADKIHYIRGIKIAMKYFWPQIIKTDLFREIPEQTIPVYIIQGKYDYQTVYSIAKEYFDSLKAPVKKFFTFNNSAHSPIFEEPEKFEDILRQILSENETVR